MRIPFRWYRFGAGKVHSTTRRNKPGIGGCVVRFGPCGYRRIRADCSLEPDAVTCHRPQTFRQRLTAAPHQNVQTTKVWGLNDVVTWRTLAMIWVFPKRRWKSHRLAQRGAQLGCHNVVYAGDVDFIERYQARKLFKLYAIEFATGVNDHGPRMGPNR